MLTTTWVKLCQSQCEFSLSETPPVDKPCLKTSIPIMLIIVSVEAQGEILALLTSLPVLPLI